MESPSPVPLNRVLVYEQTGNNHNGSLVRSRHACWPGNRLKSPNPPQPPSQRPPQYLGMQVNPSRIWREIRGLYCFNMFDAIFAALGVLTDIRCKNEKYTSFYFLRVPFFCTGLLFVTQSSFDLFEKVEGRTETQSSQAWKSLQLHTCVWRKTQRLRSKFNIPTNHITKHLFLIVWRCN